MEGKKITLLVRYAKLYLKFKRSGELSREESDEMQLIQTGLGNSCEGILREITSLAHSSPQYPEDFAYTI